MDNDELFAGYVDQLFNVGESSQGGTLSYNGRNTPRRNTLSGRNLRLYDALKVKVSDVAAGNIHNTKFIFSLAEITGEEKIEYTITAEQLGYPAGTDLTKQNDIYTKVKDYYTNHKTEILGLDVGIVLDSLLSDCAYELYWYHKALGTGYSLPGYSVDANKDYVNITLKGDIVMQMTVAQDYRQTDSDAYTTKNDLSHVSQAVSNADSIAARARWRKSDWRGLHC